MAANRGRSMNPRRDAVLAILAVVLAVLAIVGGRL